MAIFATSPKTSIFWKSANGGTREIFLKIAQKVALVWKALKHSGANNIILYLVWTCSAKTAKDFGAKSGSQSARTAKLWQFLQGHPKTHFLKKCKGGTKENFSKIAQKVPLVWKAQKHSGANNIILYLVCPWSAKAGKDFGAKSGCKRARMAKLWQFSQGHPKPAFSEKVKRGDQGKCFKNRPKSGPRFKRPKALWCKWHYPLISMHL